MMHGGSTEGMSWMMSSMGLIWLLIAVVFVLSAVALVGYVKR